MSYSLQGNQQHQVPKHSYPQESEQYFQIDPLVEKLKYIDEDKYYILNKTNIFNFQETLV